MKQEKLVTLNAIRAAWVVGRHLSHSVRQSERIEIPQSACFLSNFYNRIMSAASRSRSARKGWRTRLKRPPTRFQTRQRTRPLCMFRRSLHQTTIWMTALWQAWSIAAGQTDPVFNRSHAASSPVAMIMAVKQRRATHFGAELL